MSTSIAFKKELGGCNNSLAEVVLDSAAQNGIFKPVDTSKLASLFEQFELEKVNVITLCQFMEQNSHAALNRLVSANTPNYVLPTANLFDQKGGLSYLTALYWEKALELTDVKEFMSAKTKKLWDEQIANRTTPEFTVKAVIPTLKDLLLSRDSYFAEVIDGVFKSLSGDHVTNQPQGFSKRMIMPCTFHYAEAEPPAKSKDAVADLRHVVNRFLGRGGVATKDTYAVIDACRGEGAIGKWLDIDGGAIRIKVFKKGTIHLELHPDMAWRLNKMLAILYPMAIPPKFRKPQKYTKKEVPIKQNLISCGAVSLIAKMKLAISRPDDIPRYIDARITLKDTYKFDISQSQYDGVGGIGGAPLRASIEEAGQVLMACGMTRVYNEFSVNDEGFQCDFDFKEVQQALVRTGFIPEKQSHQFYPTQDELSEEASQWCELEVEHEKLEPSAGQGHLAVKMGANTTCVELSPINCAVLRAKGLNVVEGDFVAWAETAGQYDRILMNPPFSDGRAVEHFMAAAGCLKVGGIMVAILPASLKGKLAIDGAEIQYSMVIENAFHGVGTNVSVIMVKVIK